MLREKSPMTMAKTAILPSSPTAVKPWKINEIRVSGTLITGSSQSAFAGCEKNGMARACGWSV